MGLGGSSPGLVDPTQDQQQHLSPTEFRAEVETLLSLRRRSISQANQVDPDLPPTAPPTTPSPRPTLSISTSSSLQVNNPPGSSTDGAVSPTAPTPAETGQLVRRRSTLHHALPSDHPLPSPPQSPTREGGFMPTIPDGVAAAHTSQDLFWLPASLHPELAPQEFKAFIKEQTKPESLARRSSLSAGGSGIGRKKSMLRGEYKPTKDDGVGEVEDPNRLTIDGGMKGHTRLNFEELTIDDLQRLEMLAARAEAEGIDGDGEGEGERLGRVLRRSLSLNPATVAQAAARQRSPSPGSAERDAHTGDSPLIVPPPGQILRRSARTKIRKNHLVGDGGGHRFGPSRRNRQSTADSVGGESVASDEADVGVADSSLESGEAGGEYLGLGSGVGGASPPASSEDHHHGLVGVYEEPEPESEPVRETRRPLAGIFVPAPEGQAEGPLPVMQLSPTRLDHDQQPAPAVDPYAQFDIDDDSAAPPPLPPKEREPIKPPLPSAPEYDWATHHQEQVHLEHAPQPTQPLPPPTTITVPPAQVVPPPERRDSMPKTSPAPTPSPSPSPVPSPVSPPSPARPPITKAPTPPAPSPTPPSRPGSVKEGSIKEKKSGWARLGLGSSTSKEDKAAKKSKAADKEKQREKEQRDKAAQEQAAYEQRRQAEREKQKEKEEEKQKEKQHQKEKSKEKEGGFLGGLFGKRKAEPQEPPASPPPPVRQYSPPPPTASGALMPDGRYTNFYRLPIHVERAVYRLSHIKLANPRRPLYEQVLISNLMFWYLSVINNAQPAPIPTAPAVPVPGMRKKEQEERERAEGQQGRSGGGERRGGGRTGRQQQGQYDHQNRQFDERSHAGPSSPSGGTRSSAPADLYAGSIISSTSEDEDDDDVPLGQRQRRSEPPRPVQVREPPKQAGGAGFEVMSRRKSQEEGQELQQQQHQHPGAYHSSESQQQPASRLSPPQGHRRLSSSASINSVASDRSSASFDEANFLDAYSVSSPVGASGIAAPAPVEGAGGWGGAGAGEGRKAGRAYA